MTLFTVDTLRKLWPHGDSKIPGLIAGIASAAPAVFAKYGFNPDGPEIAQAMAQFSHECGAGLEMTENINYTAQRAVEVWPSRFSSPSDCYQKIGSYPGDQDFPGKLMDSVYGSRMGNRAGTHDGRTYIGRGPSQCTGRDGYARVDKAVPGYDLLNHPDRINDPAMTLEFAVADFVACGCLPYAKADDILMVTRKLNGGTVGLEQRKSWLVQWRKALAAQVISVPMPTPAPQPPTPPVIKPKHVAWGAGLVAAAVAAYHYFFN